MRGPFTSGAVKQAHLVPSEERASWEKRGSERERSYPRGSSAELRGMKSKQFRRRRSSVEGRDRNPVRSPGVRMPNTDTVTHHLFGMHLLQSLRNLF